MTGKESGDDMETIIETLRTVCKNQIAIFVALLVDLLSVDFAN